MEDTSLPRDGARRTPFRQGGPFPATGRACGGAGRARLPTIMSPARPVPRPAPAVSTGQDGDGLAARAGQAADAGSVTDLCSTYWASPTAPYSRPIPLAL